MKLSSKLLLGACIAGLGFSSSASVSEAAEAKLYGSVIGAVGFLSDTAPDGGEAKTSDIAILAGDDLWGGPHKLGVNVMEGDVKAKIELDVSNMGLRQAHVSLPAAGGTVTVGKQNRPYATIAWATDNLTVGAPAGSETKLSVAGAVYSSRAEGITYSGEAGAVSFSAGLMEAATGEGYLEDKGASRPDMEAAVELAAGPANIGVGIHLGDASITDGAEQVSQGTTALAVYVGLKAGPADLVIGLVPSADPVFTNLTGGSLNVDQTDKITALSVWAGIAMGENSLGLYFGDEKTDSDGVVTEAQSIGANFSMPLEVGSAFFEFGSISGSNDGTSTGGGTAIAGGYSLSWGE